MKHLTIERLNNAGVFKITQYNDHKPSYITIYEAHEIRGYTFNPTPSMDKARPLSELTILFANNVSFYYYDHRFSEQDLEELDQVLLDRINERKANTASPT